MRIAKSVEKFKLCDKKISMETNSDLGTGPRVLLNMFLVTPHLPQHCPFLYPIFSPMTYSWKSLSYCIPNQEETIRNNKQIRDIRDFKTIRDKKEINDEYFA